MRKKWIKKLLCLTLAATLTLSSEGIWALDNNVSMDDFETVVPAVDKTSAEYKSEQKVENYLEEEIFNDSDDGSNTAEEARAEVEYDADEDLEELGICEDEEPGESKDEPGSETEPETETESESEEPETPTENQPKNTKYYLVDKNLDPTGHTLVVINQNVDIDEDGEYELVNDGKYEMVGSFDNADCFNITENLNKTLRAADKFAKLESAKADGMSGNDAWDDTSIYTVIVPAGNYCINKTIRLYHNTTLDMRGQKSISFDEEKGEYNITDTPAESCAVTMQIRYSKFDAKKGEETKINPSSFNMLILGTTGTYDGNKYYNVSSKVAGYGGFKNIKILGGTWIGEKATANNSSLIVRMSHAKNVSFDGVTFQYGGGKHQLEFAAMDELEIKNCVMKDYNQPLNTKTGRRESIQLDVVCAKDQYPSSFADGTPMKNVSITNCQFTDVPRGVGGHTILTGCYFDNINISNNTFTNVYEEAVVALNWANSNISNNTMTNVGGGILCQSYNYQGGNTYTSCQSNRNYYLDGYTDTNGKVYKEAEDNKDFILPSNSSTVKVYNQPYAIDYKTSMNMTISNNNITTAYKSGSTRELQGIKVWGYDSTVTSYKGIDGVVVPARDYCSGGYTITGNTITSAGYGIHLQDVKDSTVSGNVLKQLNVDANDKNKTYYDGIYTVGASSNVNITYNTITDFADCGLYVGNYSNNVSGTYNTISGVLHGIMNATSASANTYTFNNISNTRNLGIYIKASNAREVSYNTLSNIGTTAIYFYSLGSVDSMVGNNISTVKNHGIYLSGSSVGTLANNTVSSVGANAIYLYNQSSAVNPISGNIVDTAKNSGIKISGSTCSSIEANTLNNISGEVGLIVYTSTVGDIKNNTITISGKASKGYCPGIKLSTNSTCANISSNTITSAEGAGNILGYGIYVYKNCLVNGAIQKNKITKPQGDVIFIDNSNKTNEIRFTENKLTGNGAFCGFYLKSGKVNISKNTIKKVASGICIAAKCAGTVAGNNSFSGVTNQVYVATKKSYTVSNTAVKIKAVTGGYKQGIISWNKSANAGSYEIQLATKKNFKSGLKKYTVNSKTLKKTVTKLKAKKTYYVRVRTVKKCNGVSVYSKFSTVKKFKTK